MLDYVIRVKEGVDTAKFITVFKRYEKKYFLSLEQYEALRKVLDERMHVDKYGRSLIQNIYYDTPDFYLIRASIESPFIRKS